MRGLPSLLHPSDGRAGAQLSLGVSSFGGLSLRETFNRPIAVGAGTRFVISFHQALAGTDEQRKKRFDRAAKECEQLERAEQGRHPGRQSLWEAMGGRGAAPAPLPSGAAADVSERSPAARVPSVTGPPASGPSRTVPRGRL
jgi:hypothetical protein